MTDEIKNPDPEDYGILLTSCASEKVKTAIINALLEHRLAACIQVIAGVESHYFWKDKITRSDEFLLIIKTLTDYYQQAEEVIRSHHDYEVAEIIFIPLSQGNDDYLSWMRQELVKPAES